MAAPSLPPGMPPGAGEPLRWAAETAAACWLDARGQAPAPQRAMAAAMVEYLAGALDGAAWLPDAAHLAPRMRRARDAMRLSLGLSPTADPQRVLDALLGADAALRAGDAAGAARHMAAIAAPGADPARGLDSRSTPAALAEALRALRFVFDQASLGRP